MRFLRCCKKLRVWVLIEGGGEMRKKEKEDEEDRRNKCPLMVTRPHTYMSPSIHEPSTYCRYVIT